ncbi:hypothetical protein GQ44DRAFT_743007 [Phaeosphaeriaceae sp. PMI808]|nr:hypothetical protein GQ44DRAFT_743007 [Phaeosphaeriaceae sp. PMI808]
MPMPEAGATSPTGSTTNLQPGLLEERRNWVRNDREVKLDIFLSLAEDVMQEVFEDGPPLPPSNLTAQDMLEALDDRFAEFSFEAYHHAFCHFLNLHIGQYASIQEFNQEFLMTLEDLLDHGHPLSNVQACSAYFSKLRCTQNPWVIKKLEEWDAQAEEIDCIELLKEGGDSPWAVVRPLATKSSQNFQVDSIPEEYLEDSSASDSDRRSEQSCGSIVSSISSHPQQEPDTTEHTEPLQEAKAKRQASVATANSLEITVHVSSEDMPEVNTQTHNKEREMLPLVIPERKSSKDYLNVLSKAKKMESPLPEWLVSNQGVFGQYTPRPHSSRATMPFTQAAYHLPAQSDQEHIVAPETSVDNNDNNDDGPHLPLQGTRDSAWEYLYESKGGYLGLERVPTVEEVVVVARGVSPEVAGEGLQAKRSVVDFVARLSGDSLLESSEEVREKKQKKKRSWNVGVNLARFSASKGVKEIA